MSRAERDGGCGERCGRAGRGEDEEELPAIGTGPMPTERGGGGRGDLLEQNTFLEEAFVND